MSEQEKILEEIGFSKKKARIYLAILRLGEASVIDVAKEMSIKRTTVYNILPELISDGFVQRTVKNKKSIFFIENPNLLKTNAEEKLKLIERALPGIRSLQNVVPFKPKIIFFEGFGGAKELYRDTLDSSKSGDTILSFTGITDYQRLIPKDISKEYIADRVKKKIRIKVIATPSEIAQKWQQDAQKELREIKIVTDQRYKFDGDIEIYANKVALISYKENFMGVVIESKEISQMQRLAFEIMWDAIK